MKQPIGWARVKGPSEVNVGSQDHVAATLRRGAWYPVVQDDASQTVVLGVSRAELPVPREALQIRRHQSERFSVVARAPDDPNPVRGTPADLGPSYAVCPTTRSRVRLTEQTDSLECPRCAADHPIAWDQLC